jgi:UDP-N-acetylmuramate dehydrogenase
LPVFGNGDEFKVSAGFLIEKAGFKGEEINGFFVYEKNALVLTNPSGANFTSLIAAKNKIQKRIFEMFNINLEPEVNIIV